MRALLQRVKEASVTVAGERVSSIGPGLVVLLGIAKGDSEKDIAYLARKMVNLRIFSDDQGKLNLSLIDIGGEALIVSQFTLYANCKKGLRPGFDQAAPAEEARILYEEFIRQVKDYGIATCGGIFQADMLLQIANDGPVTIMLESE